MVIRREGYNSHVYALIAANARTVFVIREATAYLPPVYYAIPRDEFFRPRDWYFILNSFPSVAGMHGWQHRVSSRRFWDGVNATRFYQRSFSHNKDIWGVIDKYFK